MDMRCYKLEYQGLSRAQSFVCLMHSLPDLHKTCEYEHTSLIYPHHSIHTEYNNLQYLLKKLCMCV
jgi:hypothetical protein